LYTWIYRITSTRTINYLKKKKIKQIFSIDEATNKLSHADDIVKNFEDKEKLQRVENALQKSPTKQREVFLFRVYEGLSYEEISQITGKSIGGLKANYFHAANKIMELMKDDEK
jgi:RNA polymerase sigma-70 factor (ECF subfamily)